MSAAQLMDHLDVSYGLVLRLVRNRPGDTIQQRAVDRALQAMARCDKVPSESDYLARHPEADRTVRGWSSPPSIAELAAHHRKHAQGGVSYWLVRHPVTKVMRTARVAPSDDAPRGWVWYIDATRAPLSAENNGEWHPLGWEGPVLWSETTDNLTPLE